MTPPLSVGRAIRRLGLGAALLAGLLAPGSAFATNWDVLDKGTQYCADSYAGHPSHFGSTNSSWVIDINFPDDAGKPLRAPENGSVTVASTSGGYGNSIVWTNSAGTEQLHLAHLATIDRTGAVVAGQQIGTIGNTGLSTGAHLHISRRANGAVAPVVLSGQTLNPAFPPDAQYGFWPCRTATYTSAGQAPSSGRDFNGDGRDDLAWYHEGNHQIAVLASNGSGLAIPFRANGIGKPDWAGVGDFNGDGKADIAWYHVGNHTISGIASTGSGFGIPWSARGIGMPQWAGVGDFNGDGKDDLAWYHEGNHTIHVLASSGAGLWTAWTTGGIGKPDWAGVGDFNGDGKDDLAWYHEGNRTIHGLTSTGTQFLQNWSTGGIGKPDWAGAGDFTGDGKDDLAWYHVGNHTIHVLASTGSGLRTAWTTAGIGLPNWAGVGNFSGDSKDDLAWYHVGNHTIHGLTSNGSQFLQNWSTGGIGLPDWAGDGGFARTNGFGWKIPPAPVAPGSPAVPSVPVAPGPTTPATPSPRAPAATPGAGTGGPSTGGGSASNGPGASPPPRVCTVPRLAGLTVKAAKTRLVRNGCRLGAITYVGRKNPRADKVISVKRRVGIRLARGASVAVVVRR